MANSLLYSMGVSVDGFIADRQGDFNWTVPGDELFRFHIQRAGELGGFVCGRRLYEIMLVWETDPAMRRTNSTRLSPISGPSCRRWCSVAR